MHDDLIAAIVDWNPLLAGSLERTTPLITSARLMRQEWDDVDSIIRFVQRRGSHK